jgi:hypothetical protein
MRPWVQSPIPTPLQKERNKYKIQDERNKKIYIQNKVLLNRPRTVTMNIKSE